MSAAEQSPTDLDVQSFRKKPVIIQAMHVSMENALELSGWFPDGVAMVLVSPGKISVHIQTLEGTMRADEGDWVIRGVQGEFYPCKPDIFEQTYEHVHSDEVTS